MFDIREPTPNPTLDRGSERGEMSQTCAYCGDEIDADEWHPVATVRDDDGDVEVYTFCSEACRAAWDDD